MFEMQISVYEQEAPDLLLDREKHEGAILPWIALDTRDYLAGRLADEGNAFSLEQLERIYETDKMLLEQAEKASAWLSDIPTDDINQARWWWKLEDIAAGRFTPDLDAALENWKNAAGYK